MNNHPVNWLQDSRRSIESRLGFKNPDICQASGRLSERLSALLLERLPADLAQEMTGLLPETERTEVESLERSAKAESDRSIGYPSFIERASEVLGFDQPDEVIREVTDAFLWGVLQDCPADLKARLHDILPAELRSRMDLYSAHGDESKVA